MIFTSPSDGNFQPLAVGARPYGTCTGQDGLEATSARQPNGQVQFSGPEVFRSKPWGLVVLRREGKKTGKYTTLSENQHYQEAFPKGNSSSNSSVLGSISVYQYRVPRCISSWWILRIIHVLPLFRSI